MMQSMVQKVYHSTETRSKKPHFHDCHQIILILKGQVELCVNDKILTAQAGDIIIFSRYENHSLRVLSEEYERYVLHIDPAVINRKNVVYSLLTDRPAGFCNIINIFPYAEDIVSIFKQLISEYNGTQRLADDMVELLVKQLLIVIYRCTDLHFDNLHDAIVIDIKRQFENNCSERYSLGALAEQYSISISSLSHRFRAVTGISVMEYLTFCRIADAKQMLVETDSSIGEIVEKCGFADNSNFSRTFKNLNGISPTNFRKKYKAR